jgi:hypothetical protein
MVFPLSEINGINMLENMIMIIGVGQRSFSWSARKRAASRNT